MKVSDNVKTLSNNYIIKQKHIENLSIRTVDPFDYSFKNDVTNNEMLHPTIIKNQDHTVVEFCDQKSIMDKEKRLVQGQS